MSRKENAAYQYNRHDDHKGLHNRLSNTFVMQYLRDALSHYPSTVQTARQCISDQARKKERSRCDLKAVELSNKKFLQSKQTKSRFMSANENTGSLTNLYKI